MSLALQVPKRSHFALIGRGGAVIRSLQQEFGVSINIPRREDESCVVTVSGDRAADAQKKMEEILGFQLGEEPLDTVVLDIPPSEYGSLIGRGGSTLRELEHTGSCDIAIPRKGDDSTNVVLQGPKEGLQAAIRQIEDVLRHPVKVVSSQAGKAAAPAAPKLDLSKDKFSEVLFFPDVNGDDGWNHDRFLTFLASATKSLHICVFTITDDRISRILMGHKAKGLDVRIITDNDTSVAQGSDIEQMRSAGIPVRMDPTEFHMHHKFAVLDGCLLISGSFNWTRSAASKNWENMIITSDEALVKSFDKEFEGLWKKFAQ